MVEKFIDHSWWQLILGGEYEIDLR